MGREIEPVAKHITQEMINNYADAVGDHNPIHVDPEFAKTTSFVGTISHGMLVAASISELMAREFGDRWLATGSLDVKFKAPARPGDTVTTRVFQIGSDLFKVECRNQDDHLLVTGKAWIK